MSDAAAAHAGRPALVESGQQPISWGEVADRVAATAGALYELGVSPGDRVAVHLPNGIAFAVSMWAVLRAGGVVVPVNPLYTPPEIRHILSDAQAGVVLTDARLADGAVTAAEDLEPARRVEVVEAAGLSGQAVDQSPADAADYAVICYTSGTSGQPKGARLTHANILANLESIARPEHLQVDADDVLLGMLPFCHVFGLNVILNAAAREGASVMTLDRFTPHGSLEAMAHHGVSVAYGAPPMFAAWSMVPGEETAGPLRAAVSGADSLPEVTWEAFRQRYGIAIVEGYGLTETAPVLASTAASPEVRPGTVGHPVWGVELRLVDPTGRDVATGETGEILARGPNVFDGYHGQPAASREVLQDGWFHTGDLGTFDAEGYLTIAGRLKDLIIVSGFNVYPREVEEALLSHPGVAEAAVVGQPDPRTGERVQAIVVARTGHDPDVDELLDHCRTRLARYKLPRDIQHARALPRTALGKIRRRDLRSP